MSVDRDAESASLDLAIIGNCQYSALINTRGRVTWACFPRFDSPALFSSLVDAEGGGHWTIEGEGEGWRTESCYLDNSCILSTRWMREDDSESFEVIDFAPRFSLYDRYYRPPMMARLVRRISGRPRIRVVCDPRFDYGRSGSEEQRGSNHITFSDSASADRVRLTTDASITNVAQGIPFELNKDLHFALAWGEPFEDSFHVLDDFLVRTHDYWRDWCRQTRVPVKYQQAVLRAAMTLKLHQFEDTGAVIAATTTSIPEIPGTERNWDYRYCWLRDAAFVVRALLRLGHSGDASRFCDYLRNLVKPDGSDFALQPVYGIDGEATLAETTLENLAGYRGDGPVRVGNDAYTHVQNDVYGEVTLALSPLFYDERLLGAELEPVYEAIESLATAAMRTFSTADAGIWEYRSDSAHHVFSKFMGWVAVDRAARIAEHIGRADNVERWRAAAAGMKEEIIARGYCEKTGSFVGAYGDDHLDASLLLMPILHFLPIDDSRMTNTIDALHRELSVNGYMFRYRREDDFGEQSCAFTICSTWMVEALWMAGRRGAAVEMFEQLLAARNSFGLLSEDIDPNSGELWGNFPQTYSMLGIINCAVRLSPSWEEIF
jgi:GH15 family glucan-1,4-alpha-glucosidase